MLKFMLHRKVEHMSAAAAKLVAANAVKCKTWSFGEYDVDPRLLVVVVQVATDAERDKLKGREPLLESFKKLPAEHGWPAEACADVVFEVESQETIDRKYEGNWAFRFS